MSRDRGGAWVAAQFVLLGAILLVVVLPVDWPHGARVALWPVGGVLIFAGLGLCVSAGRALGRALTPFPRPVEGAPLAETGPYGVVRHPFYSGALLLLLGWSFFGGPLALALTLALGVLWAGKSAVEERHLRSVHPGYAAYASRVRRRLVPGVH